MKLMTSQEGLGYVRAWGRTANRDPKRKGIEWVKESKYLGLDGARGGRGGGGLDGKREGNETSKKVKGGISE